MMPENDLTKPLGMRAASPKSRKPLRFALIAGALLVLSGVSIAQFFGGYPKIAELWSGRDVANIQPPVLGEQEDAAIIRKSIEGEVTRSKDDEDEFVGGLKELEPTGEMTEPAVKPVPVKKPKPAKKIARQQQILAHLPDPELVERGASGVIPKRSRDGLRPMDVYSRQPDTEGNFGIARVVIIVAGLGISQTSTQSAIKNLPGAVTLAFAPYGNSLQRWVQQARKGGHELLLQVPMEPVGYPQNNPGKHTLKSEADGEENLADLHWSMSRITNYVGIMNYLGGRFLSQPGGLNIVFNDIAERGLLFVEDGTVKNTIGEGMAVRALLPYTKANFLIDNTRSRAAIADKLDKLAKHAKRTGLAIGVGNAFPETIAMIAEFTRNAKKDGIEITPVSSIVSDPQAR